MKRLSRLVAGVITLAGLASAGCSPLHLVNAVSPGFNQQKHSNIVFDEQNNIALDIYTPERDASANKASSVIVFFYGGAWKAGRKEQYKFIGARLTSLGYVVVIPDYTLYPNTRFPGFVEDGARAVSWVFDNIERYNGDPAQVFLMGHSAGAHIAALLHYDERFLQRAGSSARASGLIGLAGPYDFLPLVSDEMKAIFPDSVRKASQPIHFVDGREAPALFLHGLRDQRVKPRNSASLVQSAVDAGAQATLKVYDKRGHVGVLLALAGPLGYLAPVGEDIRTFIESTVSSASATD